MTTPRCTPHIAQGGYDSGQVLVCGTHNTCEAVLGADGSQTYTVTLADLTRAVADHHERFSGLPEHITWDQLDAVMTALGFPTEHGILSLTINRNEVEIERPVFNSDQPWSVTYHHEPQYKRYSR